MSQNMEKVQNFLGLRAEFSPEIMQLRGAITKKKRENLGKIPKVGGGGVKKSRRKFPISIWEFGRPRAGAVPPIKKTDQNFQKTDQYRTLFKRNNRPIPDLFYLHTGPHETNNRPIPDLTMLMFL